MDRVKNIKKILKRKKKEYEENITEMEILSQSLMNKDKRELVGIIMGILITGGIKK